jgi:hypothetical protein
MVGNNYRRFASGCEFFFKFINNDRCKIVAIPKWQLLHDDSCYKIIITT